MKDVLLDGRVYLAVLAHDHQMSYENSDLANAFPTSLQGEALNSR
jgi:hypothetical protein